MKTKPDFPPVRERILSFWNAGFSTQQIADLFKVPEYEIYNIWIKMRSGK